MDRSVSCSRRTPRLHALAMSVAALFAVAPAFASAAEWVVDSCDEGSSGDAISHTGTLRFAAENAQTGDQISLFQLNCSLISLTSGSIGIDKPDVKVIGPGALSLRIDASGLNDVSGDDRVFAHTGGGKLTVEGISLTGGRVYRNDPADAALGGCLYSNGNVKLTDVTVSSCQANHAAGVARGGALYVAGDLMLTHSAVRDATAAGSNGGYGGGICAEGDVNMTYSTITGSTVISSASAQGGGLFAAGNLTTNYATIGGNTANGSALYARGGGVAVAGTVYIEKSTISGNYTTGNVGGLLATNDDTYATTTFSIFTSTISGNSAAGSVGGAYTNFGHVFVEHATIAFNSAGAGKLAGSYAAPGLVVGAQSPDTTIFFDSSILSNNTYGTSENDLSVRLSAITIIGENNLVRVAHDVTLNGANSTACPLLGPLRDNGGLTQTHTLLSSSPAIDHGDTTDADLSDQRGPATANGVMDFDRVSGPPGDPNPVADIGALEVQQTDIVYAAGFDGCL